MKQITVFGLAVFTFGVLFSTFVWGKTCYVDSAAAGTHNGASWANAWTTLGTITGLSAGDTV
jgi:hypothetical protein